MKVVRPIKDAPQRVFGIKFVIRVFHLVAAERVIDYIGPLFLKVSSVAA